MTDGLRIRIATPDDAEALIPHVKTIMDEPHNNIGLDPGQWDMTVEKEREFLEHRNKFGVFIIALLDGRIVGDATLARAYRPTESHSATLGISVEKPWRGQGIGTALMQYLLEWARTNGLVRIELKVFSRNEPGIRLYRKLGFVEEGRHPYACRKQGVWVEDITMGLILRENLAEKTL